MASGVPIVAYESDRTRWIVGEEGFFADPELPASLTAEIERALRQGGCAGPAMVERARDFTWSRVARQYRGFFGEVVAARSAQTPS